MFQFSIYKSNQFFFPAWKSFLYINTRDEHILEPVCVRDINTLSHVCLLARYTLMFTRRNFCCFSYGCSEIALTFHEIMGLSLNHKILGCVKLLY
jgi:hypothetical protein